MPQSPAQASAPTPFHLRLLCLLVTLLGLIVEATSISALLTRRWEVFPRWLRLFIALAPAVAAIPFGVFVLLRVQRRSWREGTALYCGGALGMALFLTGQIYRLHLSPHLPMQPLLPALAILAALFGSESLAITATLLLPVLNAELYSAFPLSEATFVLHAALALPLGALLAWRCRQTPNALHGWMLALYCFALIPLFAHSRDCAWTGCCIGAALLAAVGHANPDSAMTAPCRWCANLLWLVALWVAAAPDFWYESAIPLSPMLLPWALLACLAVAGAVQRPAAAPAAAIIFFAVLNHSVFRNQGWIHNAIRAYWLVATTALFAWGIHRRNLQQLLFAILSGCLFGLRFCQSSGRSELLRTIGVLATGFLTILLVQLALYLCNRPMPTQRTTEGAPS